MQMTNLFENSFQTPIVKRFEATSSSSSFESTRIETRIAIESSQTTSAIVESIFCCYIEKNWKKNSLRDPKTQKKSCFDKTGVKFQHFLKFTSNRSSSISLDFNLNWSNFDEMQFHCELGVEASQQRWAQSIRPKTLSSHFWLHGPCRFVAER